VTLSTRMVSATLRGISEEIALRGVAEIDQATRDEHTQAEWRQIERECRARGWSIDRRRRAVVAGRHDDWGCPWITVADASHEVHGSLVTGPGVARWVTVETAHGGVQRSVCWTGTEWTWLTPELEAAGRA